MARHALSIMIVTNAHALLDSPVKLAPKILMNVVITRASEANAIIPMDHIIVSANLDTPDIIAKVNISHVIRHPVPMVEFVGKLTR